mmetsp:Transcript_78754/g.177928  ORF Transcript_78754/g.177928 Transcript_78754/m.177928 type:complete len:201 (+) Transcript_78754:138-740(+)
MTTSQVLFGKNFRGGSNCDALAPYIWFVVCGKVDLSFGLIGSRVTLPFEEFCGVTLTASELPKPPITLMRSALPACVSVVGELSDFIIGRCSSARSSPPPPRSFGMHQFQPSLFGKPLTLRAGSCSGELATGWLILNGAACERERRPVPAELALLPPDLLPLSRCICPCSARGEASQRGILPERLKVLYLSTSRSCQSGA